jgi:hypothetical protein
LHVAPFLNDEVRRELTDRLEQQLRIVLARVLEAIEGGPDFIIDIAVARRELITEQMQDGKIDRVGAVGIRRMHFGLDVGGIVEQDIKHIVAFMVVRANNFPPVNFPVTSVLMPLSSQETKSAPIGC